MPETTADMSRDAPPACLVLWHQPTSHKLWVAAPLVSDASISMFSTFASEVSRVCIGYRALVAEFCSLADTLPCSLPHPALPSLALTMLSTMLPSYDVFTKLYITVTNRPTVVHDVKHQITD